MEIQPLVEQIANSEDPVLAFSKIAANLDETWKATLAREVNKQIFSRELETAPLNKNIEFDVVSVPGLDKVASENDGIELEKKASYSDNYFEKIAAEKRKKITPDMFSFKEEEVTYKDSSSYYQEDPLFKEAMAIEERKNAEAQIAQRAELQKQAEEATKFLAIQEKDNLHKEIAKEINSEEELKTFVKMALEQDMEDTAKKVMEYYKPDLEYFRKTASASLTLAKRNDFIEKLAAIEELDKIALNPVQKKVTNLILSIPGVVVHGAGRSVSGLLRVPNAVGRVAKTAIKHPIATTAIGGGLYASSTFDKNQINTLRGMQ